MLTPVNNTEAQKPTFLRLQTRFNPSKPQMVTQDSKCQRLLSAEGAKHAENAPLVDAQSCQRIYAGSFVSSYCFTVVSKQRSVNLQSLSEPDAKGDVMIPIGRLHIAHLLETGDVSITTITERIAAELDS